MLKNRYRSLCQSPHNYGSCKEDVGVYAAREGLQTESVMRVIILLQIGLFLLKTSKDIFLISVFIFVEATYKHIFNHLNKKSARFVAHL